MNLRRFAIATLVAGAGGAIGGALFWALLNVPESNVLALTLSAVLALVIVLSAGMAIATAACAADGASAGDVARRSLYALPAFVAGLLIAGALWWLTGASGSWWQAHRGETDALLILHANIAHTRGLHNTVAEVLWIIRWGLSLSVIVALVTTAAVRPAAGLAGGLRNGVAWTSLAASVVIAEALARAWPIVYWRPARITTAMEPAFVGVKLALLYVLASVIAAAGISLIRSVVIARRPT